MAIIEMGLDGVYGFFFLETKHGGSDDREMNVVWGVESKTGFVEDNTNRS